MDFGKLSINLHRQKHGKLEICSKVGLNSREDLSLAYTPGVAAVSTLVANDPKQAKELTIKGNTVAIVSDGSAVLGLGNIGPLGALPVMEGKAILFKEFAGVDAFPIVIDKHDADGIVDIVRAISPTFAGVNLEDIAAPVCFDVEERLQDIGIPVFHDDQHGTAIVVMAGLINAAKITGRNLSELKVVVNGAGSAGIAIAKLLASQVKNVIVLDSKGIISSSRNDLNKYKKTLLENTNKEGLSGALSDAMVGADVFVGVSKAGVLSEEMVRSMNPDPFIFALANPDPEIVPDVAKKAGAKVVATGRSDYPNQLNNVLAFPGIFRGAIDAGATRITPEMKLAASHALADSVEEADLSVDKILPSPLNKTVARSVAEAVQKVARKVVP